MSCMTPNALMETKCHEAIQELKLHIMIYTIRYAEATITFYTLSSPCLVSKKGLRQAAISLFMGVP